MDEQQSIPNVRTGCICPNRGRPIRGLIYIDPACRVHYSEKNIPYAEGDAEITKEELRVWAQMVIHLTRIRISHSLSII
jgi:hypothetical protein